jgi:hypothetical protein
MENTKRPLWEGDGDIHYRGVIEDSQITLPKPFMDLVDTKYSMTVMLTCDSSDGGHELFVKYHYPDDDLFTIGTSNTFSDVARGSFVVYATKKGLS